MTTTVLYGYCQFACAFVHIKMLEQNASSVQFLLDDIGKLKLCGFDDANIIGYG